MSKVVSDVGTSRSESFALHNVSNHLLGPPLLYIVLFPTSSTPSGDAETQKTIPWGNATHTAYIAGMCNRETSPP